jgi:hypothetical protein
MAGLGEDNYSKKLPGALDNYLGLKYIFYKGMGAAVFAALYLFFGR